VRRRLLAFAWIVLGMACAGSDPDGSVGDDSDGAIDSDPDTDEPGGCFADPMALTPGTGADAFEPLVGGEVVTIWHGPQGGWHIDTAGEAFHAPQNVSILSVVTAIDAPVPTVIAGAGGSVDAELKGLVAYDDQICSGQFWGVRAFVDDVAPPGGSSLQDVICTLEGQQLEIEITVSEIAQAGATTPPRSATSSVIVIAGLDPVDAAENCN
jgi:hypothetical protein